MTRTKLALAVLGGVLLWVLIAYGVLRLSTWLVMGTVFAELPRGAALSGAYPASMVRR